ncbi:MAG: C40 family peptidase [Clostridia bacterium]|nr:C40 family peptidase [Clostridia bacterium]
MIRPLKKTNHPCACALCLAAAMFFLSLFSVPAFALDARVEKAIEIAIAVANDDTHGYASDSSSRQGDPDFDCSAFVCHAFYRGGFDTIYEWANSRNMIDYFRDAGFEVITGINFSTSAELKRGDVLWRSGHTEIYIGDNKLVGAHSDTPTQWGPNRSPAPGDQGDEITVEKYYNNGWTTVLRYKEEEKPPVPAYKPGDVNGDDAVGADDARLALRRSVDLETYAEGTAQFLACDVNKDGSVGADDARAILRASVGLEELS